MVSEYSLMKIQAFSLFAAAVLTLGSTAIASPSKTYQVTGPILEMNDSMIAVQKGKERWQIARDASTKADGEMKVGDKVLVTYTMTATKVELKSAGKSDNGKTDATASASPATSPAKK